MSGKSVSVQRPAIDHAVAIFVEPHQAQTEPGHRPVDVADPKVDTPVGTAIGHPQSHRFAVFRSETNREIGGRNRGGISCGVDPADRLTHRRHRIEADTEGVTAS